jgi:hypothetical protein
MLLESERNVAAKITLNIYFGSSRKGIQKEKLDQKALDIYLYNSFDNCYLLKKEKKYGQ